MEAAAARGVLAAKRRSVTMSQEQPLAAPRADTFSERHIVTFCPCFKYDTATDSRPTVNFSLYSKISFLFRWPRGTPRMVASLFYYLTTVLGVLAASVALWARTVCSDQNGQ